MDWPTIFTYAPFGVFALTFLVFVLRLGLRVRAQACWTIFLLLSAAKFLCFGAFGGHPFRPELPELLIWTWDWMYSGAMILCPLAVLFFFCRAPWKRWALPAVAWGLATRGLYNGFAPPAVHEMELAFDDLPPSLEGYRIVQISDLHASDAARRWRTQAVVDLVNSLEPDLICMTGDYADGRVARVGAFVEPLKELRAKDGVLASTGNHEYYSNYGEWTREFYSKAKNIRFLNGACAFPREGLAVGGVADSFWRPDVRHVFAAATNGEFRVLLQHRPEWGRLNADECDVRLQLSGHTHGGIAPFARDYVASYNNGFVRGLYPFGRAYLYVSPGSGQWGGFPMRFFNPSEVGLFTLRRSSEREKDGENPVR